MTKELQAAPVGQWRHAKAPLACFAKSGADLGRVTTPFYLTTTGQLDLGVANIRLESGTDGLMSCAQ